MTKLLDDAVTAVRRLPAETQDDLGRFRLALAEDAQLTADEIAALDEAEAEIARGERAPAEPHANFAKPETAVYIRRKRFPRRAEHGAHMELRHIPFKMNGLGNDFVMIDARRGSRGCLPDICPTRSVGIAGSARKDGAGIASRSEIRKTYRNTKGKPH